MEMIKKKKLYHKKKDGKAYLVEWDSDASSDDDDDDDDDDCWGEGEDATLRSRPSSWSLVQRRQDNGQGHPSPHTTSDEDL
jgi:hypothetical protein